MDDTWGAVKSRSIGWARTKYRRVSFFNMFFVAYLVTPPEVYCTVHMHIRPSILLVAFGFTFVIPEILADACNTYSELQQYLIGRAPDSRCTIG